MSSPLSIARNPMKVAHGCIVFSGGVGAHSLQTMTGIKLGSIASKKKKKGECVLGRMGRDRVSREETELD